MGYFNNGVYDNSMWFLVSNNVLNMLVYYNCIILMECGGYIGNKI